MKPALGTRYVMGTFLKVRLDGARAASALELFFKEIQALEAKLSLYQPASDIARVNRESGRRPVSVQAETLDVVRQALYWADFTGGAFEPTVQPLTQAWGFDGGTMRRPEEDELRRARGKVDYRQVRISSEDQTIFLPVAGMGLDLGGIGKGYALDRALETARGFSVDSLRADFGGQLLFWDRRGSFPAETVRIENPERPGDMLSTFFVDSNGSVSTSSNAERSFTSRDPQTGHTAAFGHLLDPRLGKPAQGPASVTVRAPTATEAEALSTALFVSNPAGQAELLKKSVHVQAVIIPAAAPSFFS